MQRLAAPAVLAWGIAIPLVMPVPIVRSRLSTSPRALSLSVTRPASARLSTSAPMTSHLLRADIDGTKQSISGHWLFFKGRSGEFVPACMGTVRPMVKTVLRDIYQHMRKSAVLAVAAADLRGSFRDRSVVTQSVLVPFLMYPAIMWAAVSVVMVVEAASERMPTRLAAEPGLEHSAVAWIAADPMILPGAGAGDDAVADGSADAFLSSSGDSLRLSFDSSRDQGAAAASRVAAALGRARAVAADRQAAALGLSPVLRTPMVVRMDNTDTGRDMGGFVLGLVLPGAFVVMVAVGCVTQAVDALAGERERGTWETMRASGALPRELAAGKLAAVVATGAMSGLLNVLSMFLCLALLLGPLIRRSGEEISFTLPAAGIPFLLLSAFLLAAVMGSLMMIPAARARSFREGQSMVMPFFLLAILPMLLLQLPWIGLGPLTALVPVFNAALLARQALSGGVEPLLALEVAAASLAACLPLAAAAARTAGRPE